MDVDLREQFDRAVSDDPGADPGEMAQLAIVQGGRLRRRRRQLAAAAGVVLMNALWEGIKAGVAQIIKGAAAIGAEVGAAIKGAIGGAAPAQVGVTGIGRPSYGRSLIVDPWGTIVAQAPDEETVISAELDRARVEEVRRQLPSLANRQPDAYRWPSAPSGNEPIASGGR